MLRISVANPYEYPLEFQKLKDAARAVFEGEGVGACKVTLAFVDNAHIHRLNNQFLQHDEPTDVLTFPYSDPGAKQLEGEVVIGYAVAQEYAADRKHDTNLELLLYVVHGCLHPVRLHRHRRRRRARDARQRARVPDETRAARHRVR
jgi:probable rRNA maturation factor